MKFRKGEIDMKKKVLIISSSLRPDSNSHALCEEVATDVYEQGSVKATPFMQEAFALGQKIVADS
jgi:NAD(P)H-dependent FMN reductase